MSEHGHDGTDRRLPDALRWNEIGSFAGEGEESFEYRQSVRGLAGAAATDVTKPAEAAVRKRIADALVCSASRPGSASPGASSPDLCGSTVSVSAARLNSAPLSVTVVFAGRSWRAKHRETQWLGSGAPRLVYELERPEVVPTERN